MAKKDDFALTELEEAFVTSFIGDAEFNPVMAWKAAGYQGSSHIYSAAMKVLSRERVRRAIHQRMNDSTFWINEGAVIDRLWKEGMEARTASARVNALVWVGKHLGMWKEKTQEDSQITYNVVNYNTPKDDMVKTIEAQPEVEDSRDKAVLPEGVALVSFAEPTTKH